MIKLTNKLYGASLVALAFSLSVADVNAQTCTTTPSCEILGFTKSSTDCEGHSVLKCPFDQTKLYCDNGASGGDKTACNIGDILYSDKTCSAELISGKTPIGVVFDASPRLAMALEEKKLKWSDDYFDIPGENITGMDANTDRDGKNHTVTAVAYCKKNNKSCPAFEYVSSYKTVGTNAGDWYLPAVGEFRPVLDYQMEEMNTVLKKISSASELSQIYWSSNEFDSTRALIMTSIAGVQVSEKDDNSSVYVRPVLAF